MSFSCPTSVNFTLKISGLSKITILNLQYKIDNEIYKVVIFVLYIPELKLFGSFQSFNVVSAPPDTIKSKVLEIAIAFTAPVCREPIATHLAVLLTLQYNHTLIL